MKPRSAGVTSILFGLTPARVVNIVARFPLLHAYGIGFDDFRKLPEHRRAQVMDYCKYILAYELDDEIVAAARFLRLVGSRIGPTDRHYVKADYIEHVYQYWNSTMLVKSGKTKYPKEMPLGVFALAALAINIKVRVVEELKPNFLIATSIERLRRLEKFLAATTKFKVPPRSKYTWTYSIGDDRADEQENSLQSVDAVELEKEEKNG